MLDELFDVLVRDFSAHAVTLHGQASANDAQREWARDHLRSPAPDPARFDGVWSTVEALAGQYEMRA